MYDANTALTELQDLLTKNNDYKKYPERRADMILDIAKKVDVSGDGNVTVLYSGYIGKDHSSKYINELVKNNTVRAIDKTEFGKFQNDKTFREAYANTFGLTAKELFDTDIRELPKDKQLLAVNANAKLFSEPNSLWVNRSKAFVKNAKGDIRVVAENIDPTRIFATYELDELLKNDSVKSMDGIPKKKLLKMLNITDGYLVNTGQYISSGTTSQDAESKLLPDTQAMVAQKSSGTVNNITVVNQKSAGNTSGADIRKWKEIENPNSANKEYLNIHAYDTAVY